MVRKLLVAILALFIVGGSVSAFAYWDDLSDQQQETVSIGQGLTVTATETTSPAAGKALVPTGKVRNALSETDSHVYVYTVTLDQQVTTDLTLTATINNLEIDGLTENAGLANVEVTYTGANGQALNNDSDVVVTVTVTLTEPGTDVQYNAIKTTDITFDVDFSA